VAQFKGEGPMFKWLLNKKIKNLENNSPAQEIKWETKVLDDGSMSIGLADVRQSIGGITQLPMASIDEMVERKHDTEYQLSLCREIMTDNDILPFPFDRAVILLRKEKRYQEELEICQYIRNYCTNAEKAYDGRSAKIWKSPKLEKCIARIPKIELLIRNASKLN
jgi:hypothetical protein